MSSGSELSLRVSAAIAAGVAFLERQQLPHGELMVKWWRPAVPEWLHDPSIFGTALIVPALQFVEGTESIRMRACDFLSVQFEPFGVLRHWIRGHAQWHYVPPDLDDTSCACIALRQNGRPVPDNRALLLANRDDRGRFFSWISLRARWVPSFAYWWISLKHFLLHPVKSVAFYYVTPSERHDVDAVVNANTLVYLGPSADLRPVIDLMLDVLREERELTCDKWYDDPFVVWYFFSRALRLAGVDARALLFERMRSAKAGNALQRALAMNIRFDWIEEPSDEEVRALLDAQLPTGAWPLAPFYKGRNVRWGSEELTTAFCLEALARGQAARSA
jgi:hypothetical protein